MFSGGVAEYVYGREERDFGDMGRRLGRAVRARIDRRAALAAAAGRRMHPRHRARRLRIQRAALRQHQLHLEPGRAPAAPQSAGAAAACELGETIEPDALAAAIRAHFTAFDGRGGRRSRSRFRWRGAPAYERIAAFARGISTRSPRRIAKRQPLYLMLDGDIAQTLGAILNEELLATSEILVIDGIAAVGLRLHRPRSHPHAVAHRAGDDQVAGVQRGPARAASTCRCPGRHRGRWSPSRASSPSSSPRPRHHHDSITTTIATIITITGMSTVTTTTRRPGPLESGRPGPFGPGATTDARSGVRFDWKWVVIGASVIFTVYIGVIPLAFLLWQSFRTPQTAAADAVFTLGNYAAAYGSSDTLSLFFTSIQFASGTAVFRACHRRHAGVDERAHEHALQDRVLRAFADSAGHPFNPVHGRGFFLPARKSGSSISSCRDGWASKSHCSTSTRCQE